MALPNNIVVGIETETTNGTLIPVVYNIPTYDETLITPARTYSQQGRLTGRKSNPSHTFVGAKAGTASFATDLLGSGDATQQPNIKKILTASGFLYTGGGTANTYLLDGTTPCETLSYTTTQYECGTAPKGDTQNLIGAVPNVTIAGETVGSEIKITVELTGSLTHNTSDTTTLYEYAGLDTASPLKFMGGLYTLGGTALDIQSFSLGLNPTIAARMDATNTVTNIAKHSITDLVGRQLTISYIKPLLSVTDWATEFDAETIYSTLVIEMLSAAGDKGKLTFTNCQVVDWGDTKGDSNIFTDCTINFETCEIDLDYA